MLGRRVALMLGVLAAFAASSPARAYPLNDGSAIWGFEGHGSDGIGGPQHSVVGELDIFPTGTALTATLDGTSLLVGDSHAQVLDSAPGFGPDEVASGAAQLYIGTVVTAPSYALFPTDAYWRDAVLTVNLIDVDGHALDGAPPSGPAGAFSFFPPPYAPDISLFETAVIGIEQLRCQDIDPLSSFCAAGGGVLSFWPTFTITIDRFVDPVPEPAGAALVALGCSIVLARRRTASCSAHCC